MERKKITDGGEDEKKALMKGKKVVLKEWKGETGECAWLSTEKEGGRE